MRCIREKPASLLFTVLISGRITKCFWLYYHWLHCHARVSGRISTCFWLHFHVFLFALTRVSGSTAAFFWTIDRGFLVAVLLSFLYLLNRIIQECCAKMLIVRIDVLQFSGSSATCFRCVEEHHVFPARATCGQLSEYWKEQSVSRHI